MPSVFKGNPLNPILLNSPPLIVTSEQADYIDRILEVTSSDSNSAAKASRAIMKVLTAGVTKPPILSSLNPDTGVGGTDVELSVIGDNFTPGSEIIFGGKAVATTFVSDTELNATVNLPSGPARDVPVCVLSPESVLSDPLQFALTEV